jgi:DNA polymerase-3 subunit beta
MLKADEQSQTVELTAFDLNLGIQVNFPAEVTESGAITLPARLFNDIVSRLPDEDVTISLKQGKQWQRSPVVQGVIRSMAYQ